MNSSLLIFPIVGTLSQLLPTFAVGRRWGASDAARRWVAVFGFVWFLGDVGQLLASRWRGENFWISPLINPVEDSLALWILSYWQASPIARLTLRLAIPLVIISYLVIVYSTGEHSDFHTFSGPFRAMIVLSAALFTLLTRISREPEHVLSRDWAWVTMGMALYYGMIVAEDPIASAIGRSNQGALVALYSVHSILAAVAFILIWRGMRCPIQNGSSGST